MPAQMVMATNMFILNTLAALAASRKGRKVKMAMEMAMMVLNVGAEESKPSAMKMQSECGQEAAAGQSGNDGVEDSGDRLKEAGQQLALLVLQLILQIQVLIDGGLPRPHRSAQ